MSFFSGELRTFDLCKMNEEIGKSFEVKSCYNGVSRNLDGEEKSVCSVGPESGKRC